jgi:hypothetical protein
MEWKCISVRTGCGAAFFLAGEKSMMRAAGVRLMWSGEWGWEVSQAIVDTHPAARPGQSRRAGRQVHHPDAFETALLARGGRAPKEAEINQWSARAGAAITCEAAAERVNASILDSHLCQIRLLPIGVRRRQHEQCHIGMTAEEDGEDERQ